MTDATYEGRCFCGNISFQVTGPVKFACFCHCESCRRAAGGVYVAWATFEKELFAVTDGDMTLHHSAPKVTRGLCATCGTSLTYEHDDRRNEIDVTLTSFDEPSDFSPAAHIWVEDKLPWVNIDDGLPRYEKKITSP